MTTPALACVLAACGGSPSPSVRAPANARRIVARPAPVADGSTYWQGVAISYDPDVTAPTLPIDEADLVREEGAAPLFTALSASDKASLLRDGFVVVPNARVRNHMGAFYTDLEEGNVPVVITVDALAELANLAISVAISESTEHAEKPLILDWLARVEARLTEERKNASSNLIAPYRVALGFVAVARSLNDSSYVPPADLSDVVGREKIAIAARAKVDKSALFGVPVDYRAFPLDPLLRMRAWLALGPFAVGAADGASPRLDVSKVRTATAAALLLARATDPRIDAQASADLDHVVAIRRFLAGSSDATDLRALAALAPQANIDLTDGATIANVVRIDKLRALVRAATKTKLLDGELCGPSIRFLPRAAPLDGVALQSLVAPEVPLRAMPSALDVAAWLGSDEALAQIKTRGDDKLAGYSRAMSALYLSRSHDRHASVYSSSLDVVGSMLAPSVSRTSLAAARTAAYRSAQLDSALSVWTAFRADFSGVHAHLQNAPPSPNPTPSMKPALVYVEPEVETIGNLLSLVRQTSRGLSALGAIAPTSPAHSVLNDVDELLTNAFEVALLAANDESPTPTQRATLATLAAWMDSLETAMQSNTIRSVVVHRNQEDGSVLRESTGAIQSLFLAMREPNTKRLILAIGAHSPHSESIEKMPKAP
jgi:hypothetical protein